MSGHLLLIAIGPVQNFIASARRTRDLWYGSHVLSEISCVAAMAVVAGGGKLIFPALDKNVPEELAELSVCQRPLRANGEPPLNIANKILAEVPEGKDAEKLAKDARTSILEFWVATAKRVRGECAGLIAPDIDAAWDEQIDSLIEFAAAWAPIHNTSDGYKKARDQVEKAIAARKNLRDFEPWMKQRGNVPKSSLDGARETVLLEPGKRNKNLVKKYRIADGEQLDAVGLVKRAGGEPDQFVPIVNVALASWTSLAADTVGIKDKLEELRKKCETLKLARVKREDLPCAAPFQFDASILLPSRWRPTFEEQGLGTPQEADDWGMQHVRPLLGMMSEPFPYVACLVADGDHMGRAIDLMTGAEAHRAFSRNLAQFATAARDIVEQNHLGSLVYSGGDDVLAFLPLPTALACAEALRQSFSGIMKTACAAIEKHADYKQPTLSVGIGIGHIMEGMGDLLDLGRKAEKQAKGGDLPKNLQRNALAIILDKRSGGTRSWRAQWSEWSGNPAERLQSDAMAFSKTLSTRKVYEIARTLARLPEAKDVAEAEQSQWTALLRAEVYRSLARMEAGGGGGASHAAKLAQELGLRLEPPAPPSKDIEYEEARRIVASWIDRVLIASVIADAEPRVRHRAKENAA